MKKDDVLDGFLNDNHLASSDTINEFLVELFPKHFDPQLPEMDPNQPDYSSIDSTTKRVLLKQQRALKKLKNRVNLNVVVKNTEMY